MFLVDQFVRDRNGFPVDDRRVAARLQRQFARQTDHKLTHVAPPSWTVDGVDLAQSGVKLPARGANSTHSRGGRLLKIHSAIKSTSAPSAGGPIASCLR